MPISVQCPEGHKISAPEKLAGRKVKCPKCSSVVSIPALPAANEAASVPLESLDFSTGLSDPFATPPNGFEQPQPSMIQHYQPTPAPKPEPVSSVRISPTILYVSAGIAFAIGFVMTLGLGLVLI